MVLGDGFVVSGGNNVKEAPSVVSHPDLRLRVSVYEHNKYRKYSQLAHIPSDFQRCHDLFNMLKAPARKEARLNPTS